MNIYQYLFIETSVIRWVGVTSGIRRNLRLKSDLVGGVR